MLMMVIIIMIIIIIFIDMIIILDIIIIIIIIIDIVIIIIIIIVIVKPVSGCSGLMATSHAPMMDADDYVDGVRCYLPASTSYINIPVVVRSRGRPSKRKMTLN